MKYVDGKIVKRIRHGMSHTRQHNTWNHMMARCYLKKDKAYRNYGGRGITVVSQWHSFMGFWKDMQKGYKSELTLDRINNNLGYGPKNCRWATWSEQERNRQDALHVKYKGKNYPLKDLCEKYKISYQMVWYRVKSYNWSLEKALTTPSRIKNKRTKIKNNKYENK